MERAMHQVRLVHWNATEAEERAGRLRALGYEVVWEVPDSAAELRRLRESLPAAVVIDLGRLPSQGRDFALALGEYEATRNLPSVFVDGDPKKVAHIRQLLPDAVYAKWSTVGGALKDAIARPPTTAAMSRSRFDAYSGTPLPKKLGVGEGTVVALFGAPEGFEETLGQLPEGAAVRRNPRSRGDIAVWFVTSRRDLEVGIEGMGRFADRRGLWIAWPKKSSGVASDLSQAPVRQVGLAAGLVDYKVCAIDTTWSGLLFTRRKRG